MDRHAKSSPNREDISGGDVVKDETDNTPRNQPNDTDKDGIDDENAFSSTTTVLITKEEYEESVLGLTLDDYYTTASTPMNRDNIVRGSINGGEGTEDDEEGGISASFFQDHGFDKREDMISSSKSGSRDRPRSRNGSILGSGGEGGGRNSRPQSSGTINSRTGSRSSLDHPPGLVYRELEGCEAPITSLANAVVSLLPKWGGSENKDKNSFRHSSQRSFTDREFAPIVGTTSDNHNHQHHHESSTASLSASSVGSLETSSSLAGNNNSSNIVINEGGGGGDDDDGITFIRPASSQRLSHSPLSAKRVFDNVEDTIKKYSSEACHEEKLHWGATKIQQQMRGKLDRTEFKAKKEALLKFAWFFGCFFASW
jgi:hypothetical protein